MKITLSTDPFVRLYRKAPMIWNATLFYLLSVIGDFVSSMISPSGTIESNPFAQDANMRFSPRHAFIHETFYVMEFLALLAVLSPILGGKFKFWFQLLFVAVLLYVGLLHWDGFINNVWINLGWLLPQQ